MRDLEGRWNLKGDGVNDITFCEKIQVFVKNAILFIALILVWAVFFQTHAFVKWFISFWFSK